MHYVTFGCRYARELHPAGAWVHPDGVLEIANVDSWEEARTAVFQAIGEQFAFQYEGKPNPKYYPRGVIATLDAVTGELEVKEWCNAR